MIFSIEISKVPSTVSNLIKVNSVESIYQQLYFEISPKRIWNSQHYILMNFREKSYIPARFDANFPHSRDFTITPYQWSIFSGNRRNKRSTICQSTAVEVGGIVGENRNLSTLRRLKRQMSRAITSTNGFWLVLWEFWLCACSCSFRLTCSCERENIELNKAYYTAFMDLWRTF